MPGPGEPGRGPGQITPQPPQAVESQPPQAVELDESERKKLFGGLSEISFQMVAVDPGIPRGVVLMMQQKAVQTAQGAGLKVSQGGDAAVMYIALEAKASGSRVAVVMSAQVTCLVDGGNEVAVWKHQQKEVAKLPARLLQRGASHQALRKGVGDFFKQFRDDYRSAREEVQKK